MLGAEQGDQRGGQALFLGKVEQGGAHAVIGALAAEIDLPSGRFQEGLGGILRGQVGEGDGRESVGMRLKARRHGGFSCSVRLAVIGFPSAVYPLCGRMQAPAMVSWCG